MHVELFVPCTDFESFVGDLGGEFSGRRDDQGSDALADNVALELTSGGTVERAPGGQVDRGLGDGTVNLGKTGVNGGDEEGLCVSQSSHIRKLCSSSQICR